VAWAAFARVGRYAITDEAQVEPALPDSGKLLAVADFPASALADVHTGQPAVLHLTRFSSAQSGTISARVSRVRYDAAEGKASVELLLAPPSSGNFPLRVGMPATVEIEVERISPLALLLRSAGGIVTGR